MIDYQNQILKLNFFKEMNSDQKKKNINEWNQRKNISLKRLNVVRCSGRDFKDQCRNGFASPNPVFITWYVPQAMADEND